MAPKRRLLLFTNDYPYRSGDAGFVATEIEALSREFDEVLVFTYVRDRGVGRMAMPPNVHLGGHVFGRSTADKLRWARSPRAWAILAEAAWREIRARRLLNHPIGFLKGASVGLSIAYLPEVARACRQPNTRAYAFWAMGAGLAVPWLAGTVERAVRVHRYDLYEEDHPTGYLPYREFLFSRVDHILAISEDAVQYLRRYAAARGKIRLSRLGTVGPASVPPQRPGTARTIVSCSFVTDVKRVSHILEAMRALAALSERPIRWVHFGDGPLMRQLREQVGTSPHRLLVELRGRVDHEEIYRFYETERADLFVNLSRSEGVPVSIMEAISFGVPVVATQVGGTPEIVSPEFGTGELVSADAAPEAVAEVMQRVLDAAPGTYDPRRAWRRRFDARQTSAYAAGIIAGRFTSPGDVVDDDEVPGSQISGPPSGRRENRLKGGRPSMETVLLKPSGVVDAAALAGLADAGTLRLVCWEGAPTAGIETLHVPRRRSPQVIVRLLAVMESTPIGRMLVRLTPWDPGATFWRAIARDRAVHAVAAGADMIVAGERDAIFAAWRLRRSAGSAATEAINGVSAALEKVSA
ncbi:glycosyltransferase [Microbacterium sp. NPDC003461]